MGERGWVEGGQTSWLTAIVSTMATGVGVGGGGVGEVGDRLQVQDWYLIQEGLGERGRGEGGGGEGCVLHGLMRGSKREGKK